LKKDILDNIEGDNPVEIVPKTLWSSRPEYQEFELSTFCNRIDQMSNEDISCNQEANEECNREVEPGLQHYQLESNWSCQTTIKAQVLNVGTQKVKMGEDGICPCCVTEVEDQLHLYQCQHERMQSTLKASIADTATKLLVKEGLTTPVYTAFINCICNAVHHQPLSSYEITYDAVLRCLDSQEMLGLESILHPTCIPPHRLAPPTPRYLGTTNPIARWYERKPQGPTQTISSTSLAVPIRILGS
jgi:hypothetical protein